MKLLHHLARQKYIIGFFLAWVARVALSLGALALCLLSPPLVNFRPDLAPALALSIAGALALLLPPAIRVHWRFRSHLKAAQASAAGGTRSTHPGPRRRLLTWRSLQAPPQARPSSASHRAVLTASVLPI